METFLIAQRGEDIGRRYDLDLTQLTVGRGSDNDMVLNDPMVSRYHAVVKRQGSQFVIIDLGSANPVMVNDQVLEPGMPQPLQHRDVVFIGKTVFSFQHRESRGSQPAARSQSQPFPAPRPAGPSTPLPPPPVQDQASDQEHQTVPPVVPTIETPLPAVGMSAGASQGTGDDEGKTLIGTVRLDDADEPPLHTNPSAAAVPPLPPLGSTQQGGDKLIGTPPDDETGDSPTVFIPRERR